MSRALSIAYKNLQSGIADLLRQSRGAAARSVNSVITATYWEVGRRIVQAEQKGQRRASYGDQLIEQLASGLTVEFGRGFSQVNLKQMRSFYQLWPEQKIRQTLSDELGSAHLAKKKNSRLIAPLNFAQVAQAFPLSWSAYVRLIAVKDEYARAFYETQAFTAGWSVRQLTRQIDSLFYERCALSKNKKTMLLSGRVAKAQDTMRLEEVVRDPYVLEFLDLKDEYSESDLEESLIHKLEDFLLELGDDFAFVGRQKRLRLDDEWFRVDLVFYQRSLKSLVLIDLKLGKFSHTDTGQMQMYLNYAAEHWMKEGENPPVGLILCSQKGKAVARYALQGLRNKVMVAQYQSILPSEKKIELELSEVSKKIELEHTKKMKLPKKLQIKPPSKISVKRTVNPQSSKRKTK